MKSRKLNFNWFIIQLPPSLLKHVPLSLQSQCWTPCSEECPVWSQQRSISWSTVRSPSPRTCAAWWARLQVWPGTTFWQGWTRLAWRSQEELASESFDLHAASVWLAVEWRWRFPILACRYLAEWMSYGYPTANVWPLDIKRFGNLQSSRTFLRHRVMEVVRE